MLPTIAIPMQIKVTEKKTVHNIFYKKFLEIHLSTAFLSAGTYCLDIIIRSPFFIWAVKRPLSAGLTLSIFIRFITVDLEQRRKELSDSSFALSRTAVP